MFSVGNRRKACCVGFPFLFLFSARVCGEPRAQLWKIGSGYPMRSIKYSIKAHRKGFLLNVCCSFCLFNQENFIVCPCIELPGLRSTRLRITLINTTNCVLNDCKKANLEWRYNQNLSLCHFSALNSNISRKPKLQPPV